MTPVKLNETVTSRSPERDRRDKVLELADTKEKQMTELVKKHLGAQEAQLSRLDMVKREFEERKKKLDAQY
jgi:MarR-like DNA-binding transcriptional regulator SgrR of sgrS sRNA